MYNGQMQKFNSTSSSYGFEVCESLKGKMCKKSCSKKNGAMKNQNNYDLQSLK